MADEMTGPRASRVERVSQSVRPPLPPKPLSPSKAARLVGNTGPQPGDAVVIEPEPIPSEDPWVELVADEGNDDYPVDDFGFDPEFTDRVLMSLVRPLYRKWFRVETSGLENVPDEGAALVVANHSGTIAIDSVMTQVALLDDHPARRNLRMLGANLVFSTPFIGELARKAGHTLACHPDAERLLNRGELVGVWPEGFKGVGKPFRERYKLQRFGRGGFVAAAVRTGAPIIPTAIVGAEETYPMLMNVTPLARLLGLPYFPVTPTFPALGPLGLVPLPSKWFIHFGEPIRTDHLPEGAADDPMLVFEMTDQVREAIQQSLYRVLARRTSVFG
jgi:1-acyl-sn-glycerol-3-phosphate acyltransferase